MCKSYMRKILELTSVSPITNLLLFVKSRKIESKIRLRSEIVHSTGNDKLTIIKSSNKTDFYVYLYNF